MCAGMLKARSIEKPTRVEAFAHHLEERFLRTYGRLLNFFLDRRWVAWALWAVCLAGTIVSFSILPKVFLPDGDSGMLQGFFIAQEGTSPKQMAAYQSHVDAILHANPAVETSFSVTGMSWIGGNQGFAMAFLRPREERPEIHQVAGQLMGQVSRIPGAMTFFKARPELQVQTGVVGTNQGKYAFTIAGIESDKVYAATQQMLMALRSYKGISTISSDLFLNNPEVHVRMNREQISHYGSSVRQVEEQLRTSYSNNYVYLIKAPTQQYQVIVTAADRFKSQTGDLDLIRMHGGDGSLLDAGTVSSRYATTGPLVVNHTNNFPSATIFFDLAPGVAIGDAVEHIAKLAAQTIPAGIMSSFEGEAKAFAQTFASLKVLVFAAIFVTYIILGILYESYVHPLTVLSSLPVAAFGGLATLLLFRQPLSLYAYIGLFMLLGIVEKNGIMIIDFALQRQRENMSPRDAIHAASLQRFRPILMTTLAMIAGVLPIALGWGRDGASRRSLGLVVAGGMIFAQVITLFVTPVIYLGFNHFQDNVLDKIPLFRRGNMSTFSKKRATAPASDSKKK
jgi:HAE1 family hydrophobic/amphiphilic exporter-1